MQTYEGYFENGQFYTAGKTMFIPERCQTIIILDDKTTENRTRTKKHLAAFRRFIAENKAIADEPIDGEFDEILAQGIGVRELDS